MTPQQSVSRETLAASVSRETLDRLDGFAELLKHWNARINLIGRHDEGAIWKRHIADSWQLTSLLPPDAKVGADLGSGAGFPGLIISIAAALPMHLIESDHRKAAFLREAIRVTAAPATVHACRIEHAQLPPVDVVTARALAPLPQLLALAAPHLAPSGNCLFLKGENVEKEVEEAQHAWTMRIERHISSTDRRGVILRISEVARA